MAYAGSNMAPAHTRQNSAGSRDCSAAHKTQRSDSGQACDRKQYGAARSHNSRQEGWVSRAYWVSVRLGVKLSHSPHAGQCQKNTLERKLQRLQR